MAHDDKNPLFSERVREQMLLRRILVLDGVLDDDNGTLLACHFHALAAGPPGGGWGGGEDGGACGRVAPTPPAQPSIAPA